MMKLVLGADHGGFELKENIKEYLKEEGIEFTDYGTLSGDRCDYPDVAKKVAEAIADGTFDRGILVCGTGIGIGIAANKVDHGRPRYRTGPGQRNCSYFPVHRF